jgi:ferritin-like metal-binding protein YciE
MGTDSGRASHKKLVARICAHVREQGERAMNSFNEAFEDMIKDLHNAEKQLTKALPKMAKAASNEQLRMGFEEHLKQTEEHVRRLEQVAQICGFKPTGKVCPAMQGLVEEASEHLKEGEPSPLLDSVLIASAQKVEHYEISSYGTAKAWAELMGQNECATLLEQTLQEEEQTDEKLNQLAEGGINQEACNMPEMEQKPKRRTTARTTTSKSSGSRSKSKTSSRSKTTANR